MRTLTLLILMMAPLAEAKTIPMDCRPTTDVERCLTCNAYFENRAEGLEAMIRVNRTVISRAHSGIYPKQVCSVIYQRSRRSAAFSWTLNPPRRVDADLWQQARIAGFLAMKRGPSGKLFYHADYVRPYWASSCTGAERYPGDSHIFYGFCARGAQMAQYKRVTRGRLAAIETPLIQDAKASK